MARLPLTMTRAPLRTVRPQDLNNLYAQPRSALANWIDQGVAKRVAHGYVMAVPDDEGADWEPTVEAAAAGIAAAIFGHRNCVLMGVSAARVHQAIPRAIGNAVVAAPRQHRPIALASGGKVVFVMRQTDRLEARLERLEVGSVLVTTPEQTILDLAKRPDLGSVADEAEAAIRNLLPRVDFARTHRLAQEQRMAAALEKITAIR